MGSWAKSLFGKEQFSSVGIVVAGTSTKEFEQHILSFFDEVVFSKEAVQHAHLVRKAGEEYPIVFNVYGAPAMMDVLTEMYDGGCRNVIFIGCAYGGFKNLEIGSVVLPEKCFHFDGIYHALKLDREAAEPDRKLYRKLKQLLLNSNLAFNEGINISVPAVTFQLPHANEQYYRLNPLTLEMEAAACFSRSRDIGVRPVAVLIVSDNKTVSIGDEAKKKLRRQAKEKILKVIIDHLKEFQLPPLKLKTTFTVDDYLASIISDSSNLELNVYKKK